MLRGKRRAIQKDRNDGDPVSQRRLDFEADVVLDIL
jgi:hypothetical protein